MIKIWHGLYDVEFNQFYIRNVVMSQYNIPEKFRDLILKKREKWSEKYSYRFILFTIGYDTRWQIYAITIVHPVDLWRYKLSTSENIVKGRLARQRGEFVPQRWEYNRIANEEPPYMICHRIDLGDKTIKQKEEMGISNGN